MLLNGRWVVKDSAGTVVATGFWRKKTALELVGRLSAAALRGQRPTGYKVERRVKL